MNIIKQRTLMTADYLKEYSLLPKNYNIDEIWNIVSLTEYTKIVPLIGIELYTELLDQVEANQVTSKNASLLLQIYPFEGLAVVEQSLPMLAYRINEAGITKNSSENSEPITLKEIDFLTNYIKSQLEVLRPKLVKYLEANKDLYPLLKIGSVEVQRDKAIYGFNPISVDVDGNK